MVRRYRKSEVSSKGALQLALSVEERVKLVQAELHGVISGAVRELAETLLLNEIEELCGSAMHIAQHARTIVTASSLALLRQQVRSMG